MACAEGNDGQSTWILGKALWRTSTRNVPTGHAHARREATTHKIQVRRLYRQGFTLIELMIVIGILGLLSLVASQMLFHGFSTYVAFRTTTEMGEQAQRAMSRMTRELGTAQSILLAGGNQIQFIDSAGNNVQYQVSGTSLMRNTDPLADHLSTLSFTYLDVNLANTAILSNIYSIRVTMDFSDSGKTWQVSSVIHPRNFG